VRVNNGLTFSVNLLKCCFLVFNLGLLGFERFNFIFQGLYFSRIDTVILERDDSEG